MPRLLILIASTRAVRVGGAVGTWVADRAREHGGFELDVVDLAELQLPLMDEPHHPALQQYSSSHAIEWSARVDAADALIFVMPEYNHSFTAPLKNAIDYLQKEWKDKPVGMVSYGGIAGGTRAVTSLQPVLMTLGMIGLRNNVELAWVGEQVVDGVFTATDRQERVLAGQLAELAEWTVRLPRI